MLHRRRKTKHTRLSLARRALDSRTYKTAYPKRLLQPGRISRMKTRGVSFCPRCGSEAVHSSRDGLLSVCLHCGYGWKVHE